MSIWICTKFLTYLNSVWKIYDVLVKGWTSDLVSFSWNFTNNFDNNSLVFFRHSQEKTLFTVGEMSRARHTIIDLYNTDATDVKGQNESKIRFLTLNKRNTITMTR